jgi:cytochrome c biogenesis protein CcdA
MLTLISLIVSVGLADSIDPAMIVPALHYGSRPHGGRRVAGFALGVFTVNLVGGLAIALGPGRFLLHLAPHLSARTTHWLELTGAALLLPAAIVLWRRRPGEHLPGTLERRLDRASPLVGGTIALLELPTAVPYFVIIAAVIRSHVGVAGTAALLAMYQLLYLTPVIAIAVISQRAFRSQGAWSGERLLAFFARYENRAIAAILCASALVLVVLGRSVLPTA